MTDVAAVETPCGPFTVVAYSGVVLASGWTDDPAKLVALARSGPAIDWTWRPDLGPITEAVTDYFRGDLGAIATVAVAQRSTTFAGQVWDALRGLTAGSPVTYRQLAARCGRPGAARAVGNACGRNQAGLFVPCHRARRTDGGLGGFRWGLPVKQWLIDHEAG